MKTLLCSIDHGVATVTLNRPDARNALDATMADELADLLDELRANADVGALVLTGAGVAFCAGGDVKAMASSGPRTPAERKAGMARYARLAQTLADFDRPVIAAADGVCYGAGFSLLLLSDIVLLSERARLCMVFHRIGLIPDVGALYTLPRVVGLQRARELIFSAREIDAAEALRLGIAMEVHDVAGLLPRALSIARSFAAGPVLALGLSKKALQVSLGSDLTAMLALEADGQAQASDSDFAREAARRFRAKEPAQFRWPDRPLAPPG